MPRPPATAPTTDAALDELLSRPAAADVDAMAALDGDLLILGAGGKMGPGLARLARRATDEARRPRRIVAVSRWSRPEPAADLTRRGIETLTGDLLDPAVLEGLPDAPNVVFMAGQKFGTRASPAITWALNAWLPAQVMQRFAQSRVVVFSTGNVYPFVPAAGGGSVEADALAPVGEYAQSAVARERLVSYFAERQGTPAAVLRLNYAVELRYGVLRDLADRIVAGEPVDVTTGWVNVIWQRDANAVALRVLAAAAVPPLVLNVTGPETLRVRDVVARIGARLGVTPRVTGHEAGTALLSDASRCHALFGRPTVDACTAADWVADWVRDGGRSLGKPTHFDERGGVLSLDVRSRLLRGLVIPAHPLALTTRRGLDERRQRALTRYYLDAGAGGLAVGVHTTQFAIRDPSVGLLEPVLALAADTSAHWTADRPVLVAGVVGDTRQAVAEASTAARLSYDVALVSLGGLDGWTAPQLVAHVAAVAEILPVMGFYLQPAVGGRELPYAFWRALLEVERLVAIKVAPFDRYRTMDVARAVWDAGRGGEVALYTGNDDHIVLDLLTPFRFGDGPPLHFVGGLLGQWAVWTARAVELHTECRTAVAAGTAPPPDLLTTAGQLTDANAAVFDAANRFAGCLPGIHDVLRRQGLLAGIWCLDPAETLSAGQTEAIRRVSRAYPHLTDDRFVAEHRDRWLS